MMSQIPKHNPAEKLAKWIMKEFRAGTLESRLAINLIDTLRDETELQFLARISGIDSLFTDEGETDGADKKGLTMVDTREIWRVHFEAQARPTIEALERIKVALDMPGTDRSYVEWARELREFRREIDAAIANPEPLPCDECGRKWDECQCANDMYPWEWNAFLVVRRYAQSRHKTNEGGE